MSDRDIIQLHRMIEKTNERVANLERAAMHCDTCGGGCDGDCEEGDEQFASGQLASASEATVPTGWKLAPGWSLAPFGAVSCTHSDRDGKWDCDLDGLFENDHGACAAHAVEMGALVRDEPPAEQPSRQETTGGETWGSGQTQDYIAAETREQFVSNMDRDRAKAKPVGETGDGDQIGIGDLAIFEGALDWLSRISNQLDALAPGNTPLVDELRGGVWNSIDMALARISSAYATKREARDVADEATALLTLPLEVQEACRDRAKAKAAEQAQRETWASVEKNAADVRDWPDWKQKAAKDALEPSGTGQLPSAPVGFHAGDAKHVALWDAVNDYAEACGGKMASVSVARMLAVARVEKAVRDILEPIAGPPAPAAGTLSDVVSDMRNWTTPGTELDRFADRIAAAGAALATRLAQAERERDGAAREREDIRRALWEEESVRRRIEDACNENGRQLHEALVKLARVERQRDDWRSEATSRLNVAVTAKLERDEATAKLAGSVPRGVHVRAVQEAEAAEAQKIHDEATAKERERCADALHRWSDGPQNDVVVQWGNEELEAWMRSGAPEPGLRADPPRERQDPGGPTPTFNRLDRGIRATVCQIRAWGFVTTDSGDGVSKFKDGTATGDDGCTLKIPHVFCSVDKYRMVQDSRRLLELLRDAGLHQAKVEVTFSPNDEEAVMGVYEVTDYVWPADKRPPGFDQILAASQRMDTP